MSPATGFPFFLFLTIALLAGVVASGLRARRRTHFKFVAAAFASLAVAIYFAEQLGKLYDLETAGAIYPVHITIAKITVGAYLLPVVTGIWTIKDPSRRRWHRNVAWTVLTLTVATAVTGCWMLLLSEPLPRS